MTKEKREDIQFYIFTTFFFYVGVGLYYYYNAPIFAIAFFFLFLFFVWVGTDYELRKKYREGWNESKKYQEREFKNKNNYLIIQQKNEERQRIVNKLEGRLTDDAVMEEYYHGYIQAMLDDLKQ